MVSNSQRAMIIVPFVLDFFFSGRDHYLPTLFFLTDRTLYLLVATKNSAPGGIHDFPASVAAGSGERGICRRFQGGGFWERFTSLIKEGRHSGHGSSCLDIRCVCWGCSVISMWLIRVQKLEASSSSYLHLLNSCLLSTCYISSIRLRVHIHYSYRVLHPPGLLFVIEITGINTLKYKTYFIEDIGYWDFHWEMDNMT